MPLLSVASWRAAVQEHALGPPVGQGLCSACLLCSSHHHTTAVSRCAYHPPLLHHTHVLCASIRRRVPQAAQRGAAAARVEPPARHRCRRLHDSRRAPGRGVCLLRGWAGWGWSLSKLLVLGLPVVRVACSVTDWCKRAPRACACACTLRPTLPPAHAGRCLPACRSLCALSKLLGTSCLHVSQPTLPLPFC